MKRYTDNLLAAGFSLFLNLSTLNAGLTLELPKLTLHMQVILSDDHGVILPRQVAILKTGDQVKFCRPDKTEYTGIVTEIQETPEHLKIFGKLTNDPNTGFGFGLSKGGVFAGAIVSENSDEIYTLEFSMEHKGYIFLKSFLHKKQGA